MPSANRITLLRDADGDGVAETRPTTVSVPAEADDTRVDQRTDDVPAPAAPSAKTQAIAVLDEAALADMLAKLEAAEPGRRVRVGLGIECKADLIVGVLASRQVVVILIEVAGIVSEFACGDADRCRPRTVPRPIG